MALAHDADTLQGQHENPLDEALLVDYLCRMSITAVVEKGIIKLPEDSPWPTGTVVRIEPVEEPAPTLFDTLKDFDGMAADLPSDLASNLDYYVHRRSRL
jgi:hypothetical protein